MLSCYLKNWKKVKGPQLDQDQNALIELRIEKGDSFVNNLVVPVLFKFISGGLGNTQLYNVSSMSPIDNADLILLIA